jgi:hypothetical protein
MRQAESKLMGKRYSDLQIVGSDRSPDSPTMTRFMFVYTTQDF